MYVMYDLTSMPDAFTDILSYVFIHSVQFALKLINWICNQTKTKTKTINILGGAWPLLNVAGTEMS